MMAETYYLPVAPHNCGGPVLHFATAHLAANLTNLSSMESVRRHYLEEYKGILTRNLPVIDGLVTFPPHQDWEWNWTQESWRDRGLPWIGRLSSTLRPD